MKELAHVCHQCSGIIQQYLDRVTDQTRDVTILLMAKEEKRFQLKSSLMLLPGRRNQADSFSEEPFLLEGLELPQIGQQCFFFIR